MDRALTEGEIALARNMFGDAIDYARVRIARRKWIFFQPQNTVMAPMGAIHFHPKGPHYRDDFGSADVDAQALFLHEMVHVWQYQRGIFLPLRRHPFCTYDYAFQPGKPFTRYGLEQQGEIVRHVFLLRNRRTVPGAPPLAQYESLLPFVPVSGHG